MPYPTLSPVLHFWGKLLRGKDDDPAPSPSLPTYTPEVESLLADIDHCTEQAMKAVENNDWAEVYRYQYDSRMLQKALGRVLGVGES